MHFLDLRIPEHAYMFGFFQTDGHLEQGLGNKGRLSVEVAENDVWLLQELQRLIPCHSHLGERTRDTNFLKNYTTAYLMVYDLGFRTEINECGLPYGRKSSEIKPPLVEHSIIDYYRGVLDGDGSLGVTGTGFPYVSLVTASESLGAGFIQLLYSITGKRKKLARNSRDGVFNITVYKEDAQQVVRILYYASCLALPRKYAQARRVLLWERPKDMRRVLNRRAWTTDEDQYVMTHTIGESVTELGRTYKSVHLRRWRLHNQ